MRESTQSWREVLVGLKSRGMNVPELAIGDGVWAALEEVYPQTRQQRCWMHKTMNVLNYLPNSTQAKAKQALHDIWQAETKVTAGKAFDPFIKTYEPSTRRQPSACKKTGLHCWYSMISWHNSGRAFARETRLNRHLRPSGI